MGLYVGNKRYAIGLSEDKLSIPRTVTSNVLTQDTSIAVVSLPSEVKNVYNYALAYAYAQNTGITTVDFSSLTAITGMQALYGTFRNCTNLVSVNLSNVETITGGSAMSYTFQLCTSLTSLSFPKLKTAGTTNTWTNMLTGVTGCTVHFPSNLQSTMSSWTAVTNGFGGTNTTVSFDLASTA